MTYASPEPISTSVPSSCLMPSRPECTTPMWRAWQLSVPATGLMHSDHRHPGSKANRPAVVAPRRTTSTRVFAGVRVSSGDSKSRASTPAMAGSSRMLDLDGSSRERAWRYTGSRQTRLEADDPDALPRVAVARGAVCAAVDRARRRVDPERAVVIGAVARHDVRGL